VDTLLSLSIAHVSWWFYVDTLLSLSITHVKLVVLCGYSVKFVNYSCKVGGFMWIFC
jgi:hypothetical protein